jgi:nitroimidazol reductase NimA-like FMN-containing flavoprotein (pyridoxamine 5'-phosphate oxidase superfamily)
MDMNTPIEPFLKSLFDSQQFAVLATQEKGQPYMSLMAFAATDDLRGLIFATDRSTRKFANVKDDVHTAVLIDNRSNRSSDTRTAAAVTAIGIAEELAGEERERLLGIYLAKHPHLEHFARLPSCALIRVRVGSYFVVTRFQEVRELHFKP